MVSIVTPVMRNKKTLGIDYQIADTRIVAYFLIIRCRKPATP